MNPYKRLQEKAYEYLRRMIMEDGFEPGVIYSETKLAESIGISRTPVRDALQRMSQDGYIDIMPSKGFVLHEPTASDVVATYQIRCALESYCCMVLTADVREGKAEHTLSILRETLALQREAVRSGGDFSPFIERDRHFHTAIVGHLQNEEFNRIFDRHLYRMRRFTLDSFRLPERPRQTLEEHQAIFEAIQAGDSAKTSELILEHLDAPRRILLAQMNRDPDMPLPQEFQI